MHIEWIKLNEDVDDIELDVDDTEYSIKHIALAQYFELSPSSIILNSNGYYVLPNGDEYIVLTESEADDAYNSSIDYQMENLTDYFDSEYLCNFLYYNAFDSEYEDYLDERVNEMSGDELIDEAISRGIIDETEDEDDSNDDIDIDDLKEKVKYDIREEYDDSTEWAKDYYSFHEIIDMIRGDLDNYLDIDAIRDDIEYSSTRGDYIGNGGEICLPTVDEDEEDLYAYEI